MEDARIFLGSEKKTQGCFWVLYFSSAQINNNISSTIYCLSGIFVIKIILLTQKHRNFFGYAKKIGIFCAAKF